MLQPSVLKDAEPIRLSQIESQFSNLNELVEQVHNVTQELEKRLTCVITQTNAKPEASPPVPREVLVPLAEQFRERNQNLDESVTRLRQLLRSIELP
jgi:predicted transcriptional regulator